MGTRERRMARADRLNGWAEKREDRSEAMHADVRQNIEMIPVGQPILVGHSSERGHRRHLKRIDAKTRKTIANDEKAASIRSRAANIEAAAEEAIYEDDADAIERLRERIVELEHQREQMRQANAAFRREHGAELRALNVYAREQAMPYPPFKLKNLGGRISKDRKRLKRMQAERGEVV